MNDLKNKISFLENLIEKIKSENKIIFPDNLLLDNSSHLKTLSEKIENKKFNLVVLGFFKRGKSSLINSLINDEILPYSVIPLTSIVTILEYGKKNIAKVFFKDHKSEETDIQNINNYITEKNNPDNKKNVDYVLIFKDSEILKKIILVDTPGIGSTFLSNTETTFSYIEKIDAAIFVLSADLPISKTEQEFLLKLKDIIPVIVFVLNKTDLLTQTELEEILSFNKNVLKEIFEEEKIKIISFSAKLALAGLKSKDNDLINKSGLNSLINEINSLVDTQKDDILEKSINNQIQFIINKITQYLEFQSELIQKPLNELNATLENFSKSLKIIEKDRNDFDILIQGKINQLQKYVTEKLYDYAADLYKEYCAYIDQNKKAFREKIIQEKIEAINDEQLNFIEGKFEPFKAKLEKEIIEKFKEIIIEYAGGSNRFLSELVKNFSINKMTNFDDIIESFDLKIFTVFYFYFDKSCNPEYLKNPIIGWFHRLFLTDKIINDLKNSIRHNIDLNTGRINYDVNYKIAETFRKFSSLLNKRINETITGLDSLINNMVMRKKIKEEDFNPTLEYIRQVFSELNSIKI